MLPLVKVFTPDIVCIVESWLCSDICDSEISLVDYSIVRLDRSRHGGGIILYIKNNLNFDIISHGALGLELIFVSIFLHNNRSIRVGVFYRPPSSSFTIFDNLFVYFVLLKVFFFQFHTYWRL